jgi:hypothetical protein
MLSPDRADAVAMKPAPRLVVSVTTVSSSRPLGQALADFAPPIEGR